MERSQDAYKSRFPFFFLSNLVQVFQGPDAAVKVAEVVEQILQITLISSVELVLARNL